MQALPVKHSHPSSVYKRGYCSSCGEKKEIGKKCKPCHALRERERRVMFPERYKRSEKVRYEKYGQRVPYSRGGAERHRLDRYGLSNAQFHTMFQEQDGLCLICEDVLAPSGIRPNSVTVDHCHVTGKVRGLICHACNIGIGRLEDRRPGLVRMAAQYIDKYGHA